MKIYGCSTETDALTQVLVKNPKIFTDIISNNPTLQDKLPSKQTPSLETLLALKDRLFITDANWPIFVSAMHLPNQ